MQIYQDHFGMPPKGLWPGEGAVAQEIVPLVAKAGYQWMATGEPVLAQSLGIGSFTRDGKETVQEADLLYRPYYVQDKDGHKVAVFFRDWTFRQNRFYLFGDARGSRSKGFDAAPGKHSSALERRRCPGPPRGKHHLGWRERLGVLQE